MGYIGQTVGIKQWDTYDTLQVDNLISSNAFTPEIDEIVSHLAIFSTVRDVNNFVSSITYAGGYKYITTRNVTDSLIDTEQFTDTDGVTVLLTITYTRDVNRFVTSTTRV
jgi:hypothetical protein